MLKKYHNFRIDAPEDFADVVTHFYVAQNGTTEAITKRLVPTFQTILVFNFGNLTKLISAAGSAVEVGKCVVLGPIKKGFDYCIPPNGALLVVNFKDDAFYRFFGEAMLHQEFPTHPDALLPEHCFDYLWHQLAKLDTARARVDQLLDFCRPYLRDRSDLAEQLANFQDETQNIVKAVAAEAELSERTIQKKHKQFFGFTAKEKNRYRRFLNTIKYLQQHNPPVDWQDVVFELNYYDQSQLIHDFQFYLGITPKQYLRFQQDICVGNL